MKNTKFLKPIVALTLVAAMAVGGSLAYITSTTQQFDNKFQIATADGEDSDFLAITLTETFKLDNETVTDVAKFLPGSTIEKAPVVTLDELDTTVLTDGAYIFVELTGNVTDVMALGLKMNIGENGWTAVEDVNNVYYVLADSDTYVVPAVFSDTTIEIPGKYDETTFDDVQSLIVDAYAIQANNLDSAELAWAAVK